MRLFVAIELEDAVRRALAAVQGRLAALDARGDVRWISAEQQHVTLRFLGDVPDADVAAVSRAVSAAAAAPAEPFGMRLGGTGCFPTRGPVRIVWAGVDEPAGVLAVLAGEVERKVVELGFAPEARPFHPHVTIGRVKFDHTRGELRGAMVSPAMGDMVQNVGRLVVMASRPQAGGSQYTVVSAHKLGGG